MCYFYEKEKVGMLDETLFRHEIAETTINTRENRFVKFTIEKIGKRLNNIFHSIIVNNQTKITNTEREELKSYQQKLDKLQHNSLLRRLKDNEKEQNEQERAVGKAGNYAGDDHLNRNHIEDSAYRGLR